MLQHRKGFKAINSDRVRKRLASVSPHEHVRTDYGANIYSDRFTKITYDTMLAEAESLLSEGRGAILDATFKASADRQLALALAARRGVPVLFVECVVSEDEAIRRLERRASMEGEVSDATPEVYRRQRAEFEPIREIPPQNHLRIDTSQPARTASSPKSRTHSSAWRMRFPRASQLRRSRETARAQGAPCGLWFHAGDVLI